MQTLKSHEEFILGVYRALLVDCARQYPELTKEFTRDYLRLSSAIDEHGIKFALDTMPSFKKHFDKCLSERRLTPSNLLHFGVIQKGSTIPRLFRGLMLRVFDRSGLLKAQPDIGAIRWIRQLLGVVRKLRMESNVKDSGNAVMDFYQTDREVRLGDLAWDSFETFETEVLDNATSFVSMLHLSAIGSADLGKDQTPSSNRDSFSLLRNVQHVADYISSNLGTFVPHDWRLRHGPGAVADERFGADRYRFRRWSDRLESVFPYADFAIANFACMEAETVDEAREKGFYLEPHARLCAVPKTIKTPRLIAAEPASHQWCQQALRDFFYSRVRSTVLSRFIDFNDQNKNGELALEASHSQSHSTIDLSSASDRISCWHVERLFRRSPDLLRALQATRTAIIAQDICKYSPGLYNLRKYSTMGNATTFPIQSLFFLALAIGTVLTVRNLRLSERNIRLIAESGVRVFGDDIIIPDDCSGTLIGLLKTLELKVNDSKTFTEGNFRESCGVDAFDGQDVTVVNILERPSGASPSSIVSTVDAHNNMLLAGYFATATFLRKTASFLGFKKIREVMHGDGAFGWKTYGVPSYKGFRLRTNRQLHRLEILCLQHTAVTKRISAEGYPGLLRFFTEAAKKVTSAVSTLSYLAQRPKARLSLRWVPI